MSPKQSKWRWRWLLLPLLEGTGASWEDGGGACVSSLSECGAGWRGYRHTDRLGESVSRTSQNKQCPGTRLQGCWKPESFPIFHLSFLSRPQSASASLKLPGASLRVSSSCRVPWLTTAFRSKHFAHWLLGLQPHAVPLFYILVSFSQVRFYSQLLNADVWSSELVPSPSLLPPK